MTDEAPKQHGTARALDEWRVAERALSAAMANRTAAEQAAVAAQRAEEAANATAEAARAALEAATKAEESARITAEAARAVTEAAHDDLVSSSRGQDSAVADEAGARARYQAAERDARDRQKKRWRARVG